MKLTCNNCHKEFDTGSDSWPGDQVPCPSCGGTVEVVRAKTTPPVKADTDIPALSPSLVGESENRPNSLPGEDSLAPGTLIGQYRIEEAIGRGGMGAVYRATHLLLDRSVALKVLPPDLARDPEFISRFKREAMALAKLQHPNIVAVHDLGIQGEIYFFTMEFIDGVNLRQVLANKKMTPEQALHIVPQLCAALEYAHQRGIVHRDIKPENILLDKNGVPKIADFGLAKILKGEAHGGARLTHTSVVMGTIEYMAPEQRESTRNTDHRADIYSLGVVLYEMLTGNLPVGRFDPPSRKVQIDVRLDDVVVKALEADPDRRYQRASHMGGDVTEILSSKRHAPSEGMAVTDLSGGRELGRGTRRALAIEAGQGNVKITSWGKDTVALSTPDNADVVVVQGVATLRSRQSASLALFVPRDLEITVNSDSGDVEVENASGRLVVTGQSGDLSISRFRGSVSLNTNSGEIEITDLFSGEFAIHTESGDVEISHLKFRAGNGTVTTSSGDISITAHRGKSQFAYELTSSSGDIEPPRHGVLEQRPNHAVGQFNGSGGNLKVFSTTGDIELYGGGISVERVPETVAEFWRTAPQSFRKEVGNYLITCIALTLFFGLVADNLTVPLIIWIFWGMGIAAKGWNIYAGATDSESKRHAISVAADVVVDTARTIGRELGGEDKPKPPNVSSRPRVPAFAVFATICIGLAILAAGGLLIVHTLDSKAEAIDMVGDVDELHIASTTLMFVVAGLSALSLLFSLGAMISTFEVPDHLRARGLSRFSAATAVVLIALSVTLPSRHLAAEVKNAKECREFADRLTMDHPLQFIADKYLKEKSPEIFDFINTHSTAPCEFHSMTVQHGRARLVFVLRTEHSDARYSERLWVPLKRTDAKGWDFDKDAFNQNMRRTLRNHKSLIREKY